jgi:hypothetical protein
MKLAEALLLRAEIRAKLDSLRDRATRFARVPQGESPPEDPADLLRQLNATADELVALEGRIAVSKLAATLPNGENLAAAAGRRTALKLKHSAILSVLAAAGPMPGWISTVSVADWQLLADTLAKELRELTAAIRQSQWSAELV